MVPIRSSRPARCAPAADSPLSAAAGRPTPMPGPIRWVPPAGRVRVCRCSGRGAVAPPGYGRSRRRRGSRARRTQRSRPHEATGPPGLVAVVDRWPGPTSDAAYVDSRLLQVVHRLAVGVAVGENDVDVIEVADVAECHPTELRGIGYHDDPLRGLRGGPLHGCLGEQVCGDARLGVDAARTHHTRIESELRKRGLREISNERQLTRADFATRQQKLDIWAFVKLEDGPE